MLTLPARAHTHTYVFITRANVAGASFADHHAHRSAEDRPTVAIGPCGQEDRPVLGIRGGGAAAVDGHVRADRALAGVHMVRDR